MTGLSLSPVVEPLAAPAPLADVKVAKIRLLVIAGLFMLAFLVVAGRVLNLGLAEMSSERAAVVPVAEADIPGDVPAVTASRADLVDRNGVMLATSLQTSALSVNPREVGDPEGLARDLARIIGERTEAWYLATVSSSKKFRWLARQLTPRQVVAINALGEPALEFHRAEERVYPHGRLAAHVLGRTSTEGRGISGVELALDDRIADPGRVAEAVALSLDVRVQYALADELSAMKRAHDARGAAGMVMDVRSGEVYGLVSLPDFDPNVAPEEQDKREFNRVTTGAYELGSIFKTMTMALGLEDGLINFETVVDATKPIRVKGGHWIRDDHPQRRPLTVPEIYVHSSNIGTAKIGLEIGPERQRAFLEELGFLQRPSIELPGATRGLEPVQWHEVETMTISYGHGIGASPLQLVQAIATLVNGGRPVDATLVREPARIYTERRRDAVISPATSRKVRQLMRLAVQKGTGNNADAVGYRVGGKTGTAELAVDGGYARKRLISSFAGAFPMDDPRFVVFAMFEEPRGNESTSGYATAGWTAAPVVSNVVSRIAPLMGVMPKKEDQGLYQQAALLIKDE